uniref:Uncharacterized protein n=1 Tax=Oryza brachyantha TaxID=4533 RepID=J3LTY3_ORYBR
MSYVQGGSAEREGERAHIRFIACDFCASVMLQSKCFIFFIVINYQISLWSYVSSLFQLYCCWISSFSPGFKL